MDQPLRHYNDLSFLGLNAPNVDHTTGIRVGFISEQTIAPDSLETITNGTDLTYEGAVADAKARIVDALADTLDDLGVLPYAWKTDDKDKRSAYIANVADRVWDEISDDFNDHYESDTSEYHYEDDGYVLEYTSGGSFGVTVIRSPFYTLCAFGSPCIPNAGDLDTPGDVKTYCLGVDWFEDDRAPYDVYDVATGKQVYAKPVDNETEN